MSVEAVVADAAAANIEGLLAGADIVLDGLDNFATRYLLNDACAKLGIPWVHGGALGVTGQVLPVIPGVGPCLRCLFAEPPVPGTLPTCVTAGVLNAVTATIAAMQTALALRFLVGETLTAGDRAELVTADLWQLRFRSVQKRRRPHCPCCVGNRYEFLDTRPDGAQCTALCGRNAVQITPTSLAPVDLDAVAARLAPHGRVTRRGLLLEFAVENCLVILFPDGRLVVEGTHDPATARTLVAAYLGA